MFLRAASHGLGRFRKPSMAQSIRVGAIKPELCPPDGDGTRGIQKRQRILTYVRNHPEELRPFDFSR
jgi:hypothetical protein